LASGDGDDCGRGRAAARVPGGGVFRAGSQAGHRREAVGGPGRRRARCRGRRGVGQARPRRLVGTSGYRVLRAGRPIQYAPGAITHHKRWLAEEDYLRTELGYYTGRAAAIAKQIRSLDPVAPLGAVLELGRRLIEIPYHLLVTRHMRNARRAVVRTRGFVAGLINGLFESWR